MKLLNTVDTISSKSVHKVDKNVKPASKTQMSKGYLIFYIFSAIFFVFVIYYFSEIHNGIKLITRVNLYWLIAAILAQLVGYLLTAIIYRLLLQVTRSGPAPRLSDLYRASIISLFFNQLVPSAGISGNTFLFNYFIKQNKRPSQIIILILAELIIFYAAMEVFIIFFLVAAWTSFKYAAVFKGVLVAGAAIYLFFGISIILIGKKKILIHMFRKIKKIKLLKNYFKKWKAKWEDRLHPESISGLPDYFHGQENLILETFLLQLFIIIADAFTLFALLYGVGTHIPVFEVLLCFICTKIISILPFSPGAIILYESSMTYFFVTLGIPLKLAVMVAILYRILSFWLPMPMGMILYRKWLRRG